MPIWTRSNGEVIDMAEMHEAHLRNAAELMKQALIAGVRKLDELEAEIARRERAWKRVFVVDPTVERLPPGREMLIEQWERTNGPRSNARIDVRADRENEWLPRTRSFDRGRPVADYEFRLSWTIDGRTYGAAQFWATSLYAGVRRAATIRDAMIAVDVACFGGGGDRS